MKPSWNPRIWIGFVLSIAAVFSYPLFFARYEITRDFPWASLLLLAVAVFLVATGVARAFQRPDAYRGKISGSILAVLTVLVVGFFLADIFYVTRLIPASHGAPQVGQTAPDFTLPDSKGNIVRLSSLLTSPFSADDQPPAGASPARTAAVVLIFYRGYW